MIHTSALIAAALCFRVGQSNASAFLPGQSRLRDHTFSTKTNTKFKLNMAIDFLPTTESLSFLEGFSLNINKDQAEAMAGPLFGASLFPYLAFLWLLDKKENECPKGVTVGFATILLFVFLTIPAAIASQVLYGVSLADSDWLHGSAESLLTITNLVTVVAFRQALNSKEKDIAMPASANSYAPMTILVVGLTALAAATAAFPALAGATVHEPYLRGFMDLPFALDSLGANAEPDNALTIATYVQTVVLLSVCYDFSYSSKYISMAFWSLSQLDHSRFIACRVSCSHGICMAVGRCR
jgi:hypothetical protein